MVPWLTTTWSRTDTGSSIEPSSTLTMVPVAKIKPRQGFNPRSEFADEHMAELVESVKQHGIITPLTLAPDGDGRFTYEPPDSFIDEIAVRDGGEPATAVAAIGLLPVLAPADVSLVDQTTDGSVVGGIGVALPAPGFVVLHDDRDGRPGTVLAVSDLLPAGTVTDLELMLDHPLPLRQVVHAVAYIDRDGDGMFQPGADADQVAIRADGTAAVSTATITVLARAPASVDVATQQSEGETVVIAVVELPIDGFVEILADDDGEPGERLALSAVIRAGRSTDVEVTLDEALESGVTVTLWVRLWVDLDQDGELSEGDSPALDVPDGDPVEASFSVAVE